jgi:DNA-binding transcriptional MocR family regulator
MDLDMFEDKSKKLAKEGSQPKFAYVLPTFRSPAGVIMQAGRG